MPRKPRMFLPGLPAHIVQRGNNRQAIFFADEDYIAYLAILFEAGNRYGCAVHAYVLMTNHVHLLITPTREKAISSAMQYTGRHYVPYINRKYGRTGSLWEGRFKASIVDSRTYLLACYRYIEMNPVRAGMVDHPAAYRWTSYHHNGLARPDTLVTPHEEYLGLARTPGARAERYRSLFERSEREDDLGIIREHTQSGTPMGNQRFQKQIETALAIRTGQVRRGRPRKQLSGPACKVPEKGL